MPAPIKVAIIGGSIAGCTLANGLLKYPHVQFDLFERKATFTERGAGVGIQTNAQNALRTMGIDADTFLRDVGAVRMKSTFVLIAVGEHKGKSLLKLPEGTCEVDRQQLLQGLLRDLPETRLHANKKLLTIDQPPPSASAGKYTLHFDDGSTFSDYNVVVGCDGVQSKLREIVLGPEHKDKHAPHFTGFWDARGRMTPRDAAEKFGKELFDPEDTHEVGLVGPGAFLLFAPTDAGDVFHIVVAAAAGPDYDASSWKSPLSREFLEENYRDWDPKFRNAVIDAVMAEDSGPGFVFSEWESAETPFYFRRPGLVLMGDAAHATLPWLGQGAGQSMEDAAVLSRLLGSVGENAEVPAAVEAFDKTRRGRPETVIERSRQAARLLTGQVSMNPEETLHLKAATWWTELWDTDMVAHVQSAVEHFHKLK